MASPSLRPVFGACSLLCQHLKIFMLIQKVLDIYGGNLQEEDMKRVLCLISKNFKAGQGDSLDGHQKCH